MGTDAGPADWARHAGSPAGPASLVDLAELATASLSGSELVDAIVASEKALSLWTALQMRLLSAFAVPFVAGDPMRLAARLARKSCMTGDAFPEQVESFVPEAAVSLAAAEVAAALRISPVTAGIRVREAESMTTVLAPTLGALEAGILDRGKARVLAEQCAPLSPEHTGMVQDLVLPAAGGLSTSELREVTGQAVITVDPTGAQDRHEKAAARRELAMQALPDAMASLKAFLPADGAVKIFQVSDLLATGTAGVPGDTRGIGARRIDALVDIADQLLTYGQLDLSHYLGRELPDHGTPAQPATAGNGTHTDEAEAAGSDNADADADADSGNRAETADSADADGTDTTGTANAGPANDMGQFGANSHSAGASCAEDAADAGTCDADPAVEVGVVGAHGVDTEAVSGADTEAVRAEDAADAEVSDANAADEIPVIGAVPAEAKATGNFDADETDSDSDIGAGDNGNETSRCVRKSATTSATARTFTRQGRRPHLSVTLGLGTLAGLDESPGTLAGFGAIPAGLARSIAKSAATITALLADRETGAVSQAGALVYRPRQELRDQIAALLEVCQFPSCRQPVWRCDFDHRESFDHEQPSHGGPTSLDNSSPLCRRHHLFKHHTEWRCRPDSNRTVLHWSSPTGHSYSKQGRQAVPPQLWVTTAGTAAAEKLDTMVFFNAWSDPIPAQDSCVAAADSAADSSVIEELVTALLLQHQLNKPSFEYEHIEDAWAIYADGRLKPGPDGASADVQDQDDDLPPF